MKKLITVIFSLLVTFSSVSSPVYALVWDMNNTVGQKHAGGFYFLDSLGGGSGGKSFVGGGTVIVDWRDLEPVEGQFNWDLLFNKDATYTSWRGGSPGRVPAAWFYGAADLKRTVRFKIYITDGTMPPWLYGGLDGKLPNPYGTVCAFKSQEQINTNSPDCNANAIAISMAFPSPDNTYPVWWNPIFQQKLQNMLNAVGKKIENDPVLSNTIEFVEASVGNFGEMILWGKSTTWNPDSYDVFLWKKSGYTNAKYSEAVLNILSSYINAFPKQHVALSLGTGLYASPFDDGSGVSNVSETVLTDGMDRWGSRLFLKFAGYGGNRYGHTFNRYCPLITKCIYESFGGIKAWGGWPWDGNHAGLEAILNSAVEDHAYIAMMWDGDFKNGIWGDPSYPDLEQAFVNVAPNMMPKISFDIWGTTYPVTEFSSQTVPAGSSFTYTGHWMNQSDSPLVRFNRTYNPVKGTYKGILDTYPIYFDLVNTANQVVFRTTFIPSPGTHLWRYGTYAVTTSIYVPGTVPPGVYTPRVAIPLNKGLTKFWKIGGVESGLGDGPYPLDKKITVTTAVNNPSPTPGSFCLRGGVGNINCDLDGVIDSSDLNALLDSWKTPKTPVAGFRSADLSADNKVDAVDLTVLLDNWGNDPEW